MFASRGGADMGTPISLTPIADAVQREVHAELSRIPAHHRFVAVGFCDFRGQWKVVVATRVGDHLEFGATAQHSLDRGIQGGVHFRGSW